VAISSRIRLARNLADMPFLSRCDDAQQLRLEQRLRQEILQAEIASEVFYVDIASAGTLDRRLLVARHLISRQHAEAKHPRGVAVSSDETLAVMVNEEDHLRIQILRSGLDFQGALDQINRVDDLLEQRLDFAFHSRYGYLTACPTNVGTGLRVSVMLHLPALKMTGQIEKAFRAARDMHLAIRGLYGEGTEASGDFFQISNQSTLGRTEPQIIEEFVEQTIPRFVDYERQARQVLCRKQSEALDDKVYRSLAILQAARTISSEETLYLLSLVRLGLNLGRIDNVELATVNELFLLTQPAHLQKILRREMNARQRGTARAEFVRRRLGTN